MHYMYMKLSDKIRALVYLTESVVAGWDILQQRDVTVDVTESTWHVDVDVQQQILRNSLQFTTQSSENTQHRRRCIN